MFKIAHSNTRKMRRATERQRGCAISEFSTEITPYMLFGSRNGATVAKHFPGGKVARKIEQAKRSR